MNHVCARRAFPSLGRSSKPCAVFLVSSKTGVSRGRRAEGPSSDGCLAASSSWAHDLRLPCADEAFCGVTMALDRQGGDKSAPHSSKVALLIIDMISDFEFEDGKRLFLSALPTARHILNLKKRAKASDIPTIYVNDNFGQWRSDFRQLVHRCVNQPVRGQPIARMLAPGDDDYFVLKPANSGFFSTPLRTLLQLIGVETLVLTGVTSNQCVLFTAADAYVRNYQLVVPKDCVAAVTNKDNEFALKYFKSVLKADVRSSSRIRLPRARVRRKHPSTLGAKQRK